MNQINFITELNSLLRIIESKKYITNCYLLGNDLVSLVEKGDLFYKSFGSNIFLFKRGFDGQFFDMYYYIHDSNLSVNVNYHVPIVVEIPYRGISKFPQNEIDYLIKYGFAEHINRDLMFLNKPLLEDLNPPPIAFYTGLVDDLTLSTIISEAIKKTFDYYTGDIMSSKQIEKSIEKKEILAVYSGDKLVGFLRFYTKNKVSWIGHIVVFEEYLGQGIGKLLVYEYLKYQMSLGINSFQHWVMSTNYAAQKLYDYFGFTKMNKSSISLIKK